MNRKSSKFRSVDMTYGRMERIKAMLPLMHRANRKGMNINQAAEWLGWSPSCLRNWTRITGFQWKNRRNRRGYKFDKTGWEAKIQEMRAQGKTHAQIAVALGVGEWNVSRFIKDNGLQLPNRNNRLMP
jgi:hypothetical protein